MTFFGHKIIPSGITLLPEKVKAIAELPKPNNKKDLQRLFGGVKFLPQDSFLESQNV